MRELLGGTEENSVSLIGVIDLPSRQINDFYKKETEKIELVARPGFQTGILSGIIICQLHT